MKGDSVRIKSWGATDVGKKRDHNEDSYMMMPEHNVFVVADGMGGHAGGEMASGMSVRTIEQVIRNGAAVINPDTEHAGPIQQSPVAALLADSIRAASNAVFQKSQMITDLEGMGTTTVAMCFHRGYGFVAHVGDSRCYLIRGKNIKQLSDDHSLVNEQLKAGLITKSQAETSRFKNIITRSVGFDTHVEVDRLAVRTEPHDIFLMCSDGLTGHVEEDEIRDVVNNNLMHRLPEILIDMANERGGDDNTTVVVMYVADESDVDWSDAASDIDHEPGGAAWNAGHLGSSVG